MHEDRDAAIDRLATRLDSANRIAIVTGAGVSAGSGVPTFRGTDALWRTYRAEDLATADAFARNAAVVWQWYDWRRQRLAGSAPNRAHTVLAAWSRRAADVTVITQNVDGLHERAGTRGVVRFHGSIWELRCWQACTGSAGPWRNEATPLSVLPPRCPACGGLARPNVVWFGETIDPDVIKRSRAAANCDLFLTVGTSALVHPAAALVSEARAHGAFTAEINLEPTPVSERVDLTLRGPAEIILAEVDAARDLRDRSA